ncbi:MAG: Gfo/Idh/MocA family oxidoreductase [Phycisphaerae bacterium]|nr:Gfo/Idh/MocA family oxidoreductase [Phycisphaerae bacterium]
MKYLIVGGGSMGRRRIRCLIANGVGPDDMRLVDVREDRRAEVKVRHDVVGVADLLDGMRWGPDVVIVSVPPSEHMGVCLTAARAGKHFFCEVPLSLNFDGVDELTELIDKKGIIAAPGIQAAFHPLVKQLKAWLDDPAFGDLLAIHQEWGQYLPDWHPYEDYRSFYAAKQAMGGAALDILGHEMAMLYWLMDDRIDRVICHGGRLSSLEIEGNDTWQILAETRGGVRAMLHYDLIQRDVHNTVRFVSEAGTIELSIGGSVVDKAWARRFLASTGQWEQALPPEGFAYEQCYIDEIGHLLRCLRDEATWHVPWEAALDVVRFVVASVQSDAQQEWVAV